MPDSTEEKLNELQELLEETAAMTKENHRLLKDMRRMGRISFWAKLLLWIIVLGVPFLFIGPLFQAAFPGMGGGKSFLGIPTTTEIEKAFTQLKNQSMGKQQ